MKKVVLVNRGLLIDTLNINTLIQIQANTLYGTISGIKNNRPKIKRLFTK